MCTNLTMESISRTPRGSGALQPPSPVQIRDGHRSLLATFRGFADVFLADFDGIGDLDGMRAATSFLRDSLLPFARWEERSEAAGSRLAEEMAFEHAFIAVEIDALDSAVAEFADAVAGRADEAMEVLARIRRHAARLEAVLELHVLKAEERVSLRHAGNTEGSAAMDGASGPPEPERERTRTMSAAELDRFLAASEWGMLCTYGDHRPYGVPVSFALDGGQVYIFIGPGRKQRNLEENPAVCLTIAHVHDRSHWESAVVSGTVEWVSGIRERARLLRAFHRQRGATGRVTAADVTRLARARIARIRIEEVTGRSCG
jgi:uncharacterized protein